MDTSIESDVVGTAPPRLSRRDYAQLIKSLSDNLIRKDVRKMVFLCHDLIKSKDFLTRSNLTASQLFSEMDRNGSISTDDVAVLSQVLYLIGKRKLQKEVLVPRGIPAWQPEMESCLSPFRHLLYKLYQEIRSQDLETMKEHCILTGKLMNSEVKDIGDALDLFTVLVDKQAISSSDVEYLCSLVEVLHNVKMDEMVAAYTEILDDEKAKPGLEGKSLDSAVKPMDWHTHPDPLSLSGGTPTTGSYMEERGAGYVLKGPNQFRSDIPGPLKGYNPEDIKMDPHCRPEPGAAYGGSSSDESGRAARSSAKEGREGSESSLPPLDSLSTTSSGGQARLEKKTGDLDEEIKKVGQGFSGVGQTAKDLTETSSSQNSADMDVSLSLDKTDINFTARTESVQAGLDKLRLQEEEEQARHSGPNEMIEPQQGGEDEAARAEEKAALLECQERDKPSELGQQEEEKLRRAREKERKLGAGDHTKFPIQETSDVNRETAPSTMAMLEHPITHPRLGRLQSEDVYHIRKDPKGICLLLMYDEYDSDHKPRTGNDVDMKKLKELFGDILKFTVILEHNKSFKETQEIIEQVRESKDHGDCFVCFVCSHGNGEAFLTKDGKFLKFQDLFDNFSPDKCKALTKKPKVFFMNSCLKKSEGINYQQFQDSSIMSDGPESMGVGAKHDKLCPKHADFCVAYSTVAGYSSARDTMNGTFFVQNIYKVFKDHHEKYHLMDLLSRVRKSTTKQFEDRNAKDMICQVSPDYTTLQSSLYFFRTHQPY